MPDQDRISRRQFNTLALSAGALTALGQRPSYAAASPLLTRPIPISGEALPVIGMGSSITFNVGDDTKERNARADVLRAFFAAGGGLIDSSPMYGSSEEVIGHGLQQLGPQKGLFSATKVWTWRTGTGPSQMDKSAKLWGLGKFDLMQIHNLVAWEGHLETLLEMKANKLIRYIGITTSHGRRHDDFLEIMRTKPIDFVQFSYNVLNRDAEQYLLPLAMERQLGVIINRPFQRGYLFDRLARHELPDWASEFDCRNWAQFLLKFIVSYPAVTCAIPATSRVDHMIENMGAARGRLPDADMRKRMVQYIETI